MQHIIEERDQCLGWIQSLTEENARFKEFTEKSVYDLQILTTKATALEVILMSHLPVILSSSLLELSYSRAIIALFGLVWVDIITLFIVILF